MQRSRKRPSSGPVRSSSEYSSASSPGASNATQSGSSDVPPYRYSDEDEPREYHDNNSRPSMENENSVESSDGDSPEQEHNYEDNWPGYQNDSNQYQSQNDEYEHNRHHPDAESYDDQSNRSPSPVRRYSREGEDYEDSDERNVDYVNNRYDDNQSRGDDDGASTQSESEEAANEPSNGSVTEEESERSPSPVMPRLEIRHRSIRPAIRSRPSFNWASYHPVVRTASELCWLHGVEPSAIAYARILSAGKGSIDYYIRSRSVTIGRWGYGTDCQIKSETRSISRKHAKLYWDAKVDHWMLTCLSAKNGLVVDGAPIAPFGLPVPVKSRSLVEIGDVAFYFLSVVEKSFTVNDLKMLEHRILEAREAEANANQYEEINGTSDHEIEREISPRKLKSKSDRPIPTAPKQNDTKSSKSKKGTKSSLQPVKQDATSSDLTASEDEDHVVPDVLDAPHYRLPLIQLSTKKKRKGGTERNGGSKKRRKRDRSYEDEGSGQESTSYTEEWNKKEKTDFARALFAVGVDPFYDDEGNVTGFDWSRFRSIVDFPKKSDEMLEEHYRRVMADVQEFLDGGEREKKVKAARNSHAPLCKCTLCNESEKSLKRKRNNGEDHEDDDTGDQSKSKEPLMSLVTAQKLRVRIGILEAAKRVETKIWEPAIAKLDTQLQSSLKEFPDWWQRWVHDRDLMRGCAQHGVGQWSQIWSDPTLESFVALRKHMYSEGDEMIEWPSNQAAMKRVRELGLAMMSEMRRSAKLDAEEERKRRRQVRKREKKAAKKQPMKQKDEDEAHLMRISSFRSHIEQSGGEYEAGATGKFVRDDGHGTDDGESTAEDSESENLDIVRVERADEVETEEENNDRDDDDDLIQGDEGEESVEDSYGEPQMERPEDRPNWMYSEEEFDGGYAGSETEED